MAQALAAWSAFVQAVLWLPHAVAHIESLQAHFAMHVIHEPHAPPL